MDKTTKDLIEKVSKSFQYKQDGKKPDGQPKASAKPQNAEQPKANAKPQNAEAFKKDARQRRGDRTKNEAKPQNAVEKPHGPVTVVGISFRNNSKTYYFSPGILTLAVGDHVIVETARGVEYGTVRFAPKEIPGEEIVAPLKTIIRRANEEDAVRNARNRDAEMEAALLCKKKIEEHHLEMKLVAAEYTYDRAKLTFYFICESRVDFRELVRDLASTFHTRIELHQIGIRDQAKMMGGLGVCGRKFCCSGFLPDFVQVSIKMAKEQNFSLNSAKISGACGRLMCCMRFEHETYEEALSIIPPTGTHVSTADGNGVITETRPLTAEVRVKIADKEKDIIKTYGVGDIRILHLPQKKSEFRTAHGDEYPTEEKE